MKYDDMFREVNLDNDYNKKYSNTLQLDNECNYLNPEELNSSNFLHSCISKPHVENPLSYDYCLNAPQPLKKEGIVEGFTNDKPTLGPGVSYSPEGTCPDGFKKDNNGECNIQVFRGRSRDGNYQRGHNHETMHADKENFQICGKDKFLGYNLHDGHIKCESKEESSKEESSKEEEEIIPYEKNTIETFANF